jgi:hypothetical protein
MPFRLPRSLSAACRYSIPEESNAFLQSLEGVAEIARDSAFPLD